MVHWAPARALIGWDMRHDTSESNTSSFHHDQVTRTHDTEQESVSRGTETEHETSLSIRGHVGLPAPRRGPGQPQGEAQSEIQDQEEQQ